MSTKPESSDAGPAPPPPPTEPQARDAALPISLDSIQARMAHEARELPSLAASESSLLATLWRICVVEFGPRAFHALLLIMVALTSRTRWPVSARTVGMKTHHSEIGIFIERLLGNAWVLYISSQTERGLYMLGRTERSLTSCLICENAGHDSKVAQLVNRLIQKAPNRSIDGTAIGIETFLQLDREISVLILGDENTCDQPSITKVISIRMHSSRAVLAFDALKRLRVPSEPHADLEDKAIDTLREKIRAIQWDHVYVSEWTSAVPRIKDEGDIDRLAVFRPLVNVWLILQGATKSANPDPASERKAICEVVALLDKAGVEDARERIGPRPTQCLRILQRNEPLANAALNSTSNDESASSDSQQEAMGQKAKECGAMAGPFTVQGLLSEFAGFDGDTIRLWLDELVNHGLVCRGARSGHRITYGLTERGRTFETRRLSTTIRHLLGIAATAETSEKPVFGASSPDGPV